MSIAISALTIGAKGKQKSEGTLRGHVNQSETLRLKCKHLFQLVKFCTARNLLAFSSRIETLHLCYEGAITFWLV